MERLATAEVQSYSTWTSVMVINIAQYGTCLLSHWDEQGNVSQQSCSTSLGTSYHRFNFLSTLLAFSLRKQDQTFLGEIWRIPERSPFANVASLYVCVFSRLFTTLQIKKSNSIYSGKEVAFNFGRWKSQSLSNPLAFTSRQLREAEIKRRDWKLTVADLLPWHTRLLLNLRSSGSYSRLHQMLKACFEKWGNACRVI